MKEISPLMKVALKVLDTARGQIINGDCDEESVANTLTRKTTVSANKRWKCYT